MVKAKCANVNDPKCIDSIEKIFDGDNDDLVDRGKIRWLSLLKGPRTVFFAIVAYLTAKWKENTRGGQPPPLNFHLPSSALSLINSASTATDVVFKTADSDPSAVSVHVTATEINTPWPTSGGPLVMVTADADGHAKGDIEIDAPSDDVGNALNDFFRTGECKSPPLKRKIGLNKRVDRDVECLVDNFQSLLNAMGVGGQLNGLAPQAMQVAPNVPLPVFANAQYNAAYGQAIVVGGDQIPRVLPNIQRPQVMPAIGFLFMLTIAFFTQQVMEAGRMYLQADSLRPDQPYEFECLTKDSEYFPKCNNIICEGKDGKCTSDPMAHCPCDGNDQNNCPTDAKEKVSLRSLSLRNLIKCTPILTLL